MLYSPQLIQSLADRYARKLKSRDSISKAVMSQDGEDEPEPSLGEQAAILQVIGWYSFPTHPRHIVLVHL